MPEELFDYALYFKRFREQVGATLGEGQYGQYRGRLVPLLTEGEYRARVESYLELGRAYTALLEGGETIEDSIPAQLRTLEVELLIEKSFFLPFPRI